MVEFNRQDSPPPAGPSNEIVRVSSSGEAYGYVLTNHIEGYWTHWDGSRTNPCVKQGGECKLCAKGLHSRWKGYLHFYCLIRKKEVFLELTPGATEMMYFQIDKGSLLRGLMLRVKRSGTSIHGRLRVEVQKYASVPADLPAEKEALPALKKLFGFTEEA